MRLPAVGRPCTRLAGSIPRCARSPPPTRPLSDECKLARRHARPERPILEAMTNPLTTPASRPLRIAQIAPPQEPVPPAGYGGTERVVDALVRELVARGHDVTLFAPGDS